MPILKEGFDSILIEDMDKVKRAYIAADVNNLDSEETILSPVDPGTLRKMQTDKPNARGCPTFFTRVGFELLFFPAADKDTKIGVHYFPRMKILE